VAVGLILRRKRHDRGDLLHPAVEHAQTVPSPAQKDKV
jgi:hypothetical protein